MSPARRFLGSVISIRMLDVESVKRTSKWILFCHAVWCKAMGIEVTDLRLDIFQMACGYFSFFINHYLFPASFRHDVYIAIFGHLDGCVHVL